MWKRIIPFILCCVGITAVAMNECPRHSDVPIKTDRLTCDYYTSGRLGRETPFKNGVREGISKTYYESGKLEVEMPFKNGMIEGVAKIYHESGQLEIEMPHKNDKVEGIAKAYYESGQLEVEMPYKNDKKEGQMKVYREDGKMFATIIYEDNSPVSGMCHRRNGTTSPLTNAELMNWARGLGIEC